MLWHNSPHGCDKISGCVVIVIFYYLCWILILINKYKLHNCSYLVCLIIKYLGIFFNLVILFLRDPPCRGGEACGPLTRSYQAVPTSVLSLSGWYRNFLWRWLAGGGRSEATYSRWTNALGERKTLTKHPSTPNSSRECHMARR